MVLKIIKSLIILSFMSSNSKDQLGNELLKKVSPTKLEEQPLVENKRDFSWVTEKSVVLLRAQRLYGGGSVCQ